MMKILMLVVGRTDKDYWGQALDEYTRRLHHYLPFEIEVLPDIRRTSHMTEEMQKSLEGAAILKALHKTDCCVLLDERGREMTSRELASFVDRKMLAAVKRTVFVIGGPYGFDQAVYDRANERLSLSRMTFSHQMVRAVFAEQLYRAMTIIRGEPYHHGNN
jgi:23S rRNA (pseudouridine1915-N3)-methyltransferase